MSDPVVIVSVARTPIGAMMGELSGFAGHQLGSVAIKAAVERAGLKPEQVQEVIMGCVLPAGQGQAPARQATLGAGLPLSAVATTINKVCGSGMKATMMAHDQLLAGSVDVIVAGGMESMSNAPYLLPKARGGYRYGHSTVFDHMALDGLEDAYEKTANGGGKSMGNYAEDTAAKYGFTREAQDAFAIESTRRALAANTDGSFEWEIAPVTVAGKGGDVQIAKDESPFKAKPEKIPSLKPAFRKDGTVTAATSSSISDGAAALVLMRASTADKLGLKPVAKIVGHATHAHEPGWFTTAPVGAIEKLYAKTGWNTDSVDLFEINEAFAVVTMAAMHDHKLPHEKVNVNGGACALGHPIGASGARVIVTLIGALKKRGLKRGVASLCIGGGEATAMAVELF
ncbi:MULTISPECIES: acetyl-CoA C-acetyltransferase [Niveibacterium]|uniref:Acetyl-CoA C-acetyltransferase n=1 Tax=Niveibacterium microcysteis TaxID=2811415 RepID=A0ABX7M724_9RHOO|nr:acetyl-CoA C-acetyltransferase [Niveibacterium microcysteis]QSI77321.1 acetyl-CoA C-acetyltransferase [Niveibacterium microcysteis]